MKRYIAFILLLVMSIHPKAWALVLDAPSPSPEPVVINSRVDRAEATTSDTIVFTVSIKYKDGMEVAVPNDIASRITGFRIIDFGRDPEKSAQGFREHTLWFKLQGDVSGSYVLPAVTLDYKDGEGNSKQATAGEIFVEINSPADKEGSADAAKDNKNDAVPRDIRDIKEVIPYDRTPLWIALGAGLAAAAALFGAAYYFYRRRSRKERPEPFVSPGEKALKSLEELKNSRVLEMKELKKYHFILSDIVRGYVEERFGFPATDRTLEEIRRGFNETSGLSKEQRAGIIELLAQCDLVKFADHELSRGDSLGMLMEAVKFVKATTTTEPVEQDSVV
jgi:hypothetical protein